MRRRDQGRRSRRDLRTVAACDAEIFGGHARRLSGLDRRRQADRAGALAHSEILKDASGTTTLVFGTYDDRYRRAKSGWRFGYRRFGEVLVEAKTERSDLVKLTAQLIIEEAPEGEVQEQLGREYYAQCRS